MDGVDGGGMSDLMTASIEDRLWHKMRGNLAQHVPEIAENRLLMCCACGRFLPRENFDLEHLIPQQALKRDPTAVRSDPATPVNVRAGNLLLCKKPLRHKGNTVYENGCNSWKGRFYDTAISELLHGKAWRSGALTQVHIVAGFCLGYLAMVAEFGCRVVLMRSGLLLRRQFFSPYRFHPAIPVTSQMLFGGSSAGVPPDAPMWAKPFSFGFREGGCHVVTRTFGVTVPVSQDPRRPIARHLRIAPAQYKLRPDFGTAFH